MLMEVICGKLHGNNCPVSLTSFNFTHSTRLLRFARCSVKCQRIAFLATSIIDSPLQRGGIRQELESVDMPHQNDIIEQSRIALCSLCFLLRPEGRAGTREKAVEQTSKAASPQALCLVA